LPVDTSGINEVDRELAPNVDAEDLEALCEARKAAIATRARRKGERALASRGPSTTP
jgi:hypothetical protein